MSLDQRELMVLSLKQNGDRFTGSWSHPRTMNTDGYTFSGLGGGVAVDPIVNASSQNASIHIVVENSKDKKDTTEFDITLTTQDDAAVKLVGAPFDAWHFRRYLHSSGKPQIYGTQFGLGNTPNQDPYNQTLISDALRQQLKVPPLPEQQAQFPSFPKSQGANATTKKN
jgi:hypothetical protein